MRTGWWIWLSLWAIFLLGCGVLAMQVFPQWRAALAGVWQGKRKRRDGLAGAGLALSAWWRSPWGKGVSAALLLMAPLVAVLVWSQHKPRMLDGFDDRIDPGNQQVAHLLAGEQLVPPPPLPPDVFTTAEVEVVRPMLSSADRRWEQMDPEFVQRVLAVFKIMKEEHGYEMALLEGWRSPERQAMLAAKGSNVTMAGAWQSYHQYGLAADCAFYKDGKLLISEKDPWAMRGYELYGQVAEQMGLTWGGRWQMMDLGHIEWRKAKAQAAVRAAKTQPPVGAK